MTFRLKGESYEFMQGYQTDSKLRNEFNSLVRLVFDFDFENWYELGYWTDTYKPYSLFADGKIVANVSINFMRRDSKGSAKIYIQIGTVMTHPDYRGMGLSRFLMEKVMEEWAGKAEMIFLFANDTVLDFYTPFGFQQAEEYQCSRALHGNAPLYNLEKLDMNLKENQIKLVHSVETALPISPLFFNSDISLVMFYATSFYKDFIYYLKEKAAYIVAEQRGEDFHLHSVFAKTPLDFYSFIPQNIKKLYLGYTPWDKVGFEEKLFTNDDTVLFTYGKDKDIFNINKLMIPILSHT